MKIPLREAILCEGKHDVQRLQGIFDALILPTHGFQIYNNAARRKLFGKLAQQRGLIIVTDSDPAGMQIRKFISQHIPAQQVTHVFVPRADIEVEDTDNAVILQAFERAGIVGATVSVARDSSANPTDDRGRSPLHITKLQLYRDGFSGKPGAKARYQALLRALDLPEHLSVNHFCAIVTQEEYDANRPRL
ncbi:MAG: DUF4093 domain-containing protein [Oscillospiraceae bacterium]|nr:DUF4093 domain-containing protein [Oscillospiraceae bacterium]